MLKRSLRDKNIEQASEIFLRKSALITSTAAELKNPSMKRNSNNNLKEVEIKRSSYTMGQETALEARYNNPQLYNMLRHVNEALLL